MSLRLRGSALVLFGVLGVAGCGGGALRRAETAHIRLTTDESSRYAQWFAMEMERTRNAFVDTLFQCADVGDTDPLDVVAFREVDAFERYMAHRWDVDDVHGFVTTRPQRLVERPPALALRTRPSDALRLFRHELTHRLMARCTPQAPAWLDEGLAEVLETADVRDGTLHVGTPPYFFDDLGVDAARIGGTVTEYVPRGALLTIDALRSLPRGGMIVAGDRMATRARYASAWALVAVLSTGPEDIKVAFAAYRRALRTGASPGRAWTENLAPLPIDELYAHFIDSNDRWLVSYAVTVAADVRPAVRVLSDRERDLFWARDLPWGTAEGREQALAHLDDLVRRDPDAASDPEVVTLRAAILLEGGDLQRAAMGLAAATSDQLAFARLALSIATDPLSQPIAGLQAAEHAPSLAPTAGELAQLARRAATPFQHDVVARAFLRTDDVAAALGHAHRAVSAEPSCGQCWLTLGVAQIRSGDLERGARSVQRAEGFLHESTGGSGWVWRAAAPAYQEYSAAACPEVPPVVEPSPTVATEDAPAETVTTDEPPRASLSADAIRTVVRAHLGEVRQCYEEQLATTPTLEGTVRVRWIIEADGHVRMATLDGSELGGAVACCVLGAVISWEFPAPEGGLVSVTYPFTLEQP